MGVLILLSSKLETNKEQHYTKDGENGKIKNNDFKMDQNYPTATNTSFKFYTPKNIEKYKNSSNYRTNKISWEDKGGSRKSSAKSQKHVKRIKRV